MKHYTVDDIMGLKPCYNRNKLESYMEGRKHISLSDALSSKASNDDKIWLVVKLLPTDKVIEFAKWCADSVRHINNDRDAEAAAKDAKGAKADWAVTAATWAAWAAADVAAARTAACAAAARAAARDGYADVAAARTAAWNTAYSEARRNQANQLKLIVKENNL